ncbi:MAG TPA: hypothetical protein VJZ49_06820 [Syntrophales bacterium]|nr:hypothetical protein [Syntrophales bacterium]
MTDKEWKEFEKTHAEEVIELWQKYAPNMTWDNVIGFNPIKEALEGKRRPLVTG